MVAITRAAKTIFSLYPVNETVRHYDLENRPGSPGLADVDDIHTIRPGLPQVGVHMNL